MRATTITGATLATLLLAACGGGAKQPEYANDADTGAAAPATQQTLSPNPGMGDSTQGMQELTGQPQAAGDSGRPTITGMDTSKGQNRPPVMPPATKRP